MKANNLKKFMNVTIAIFQDNTIHKQTDRQTDRHTHTHRHTDRQTDTDT